MEPLSNWDAMFVAAASPHATLPRAKGCIKVSVHPNVALQNSVCCLSIPSYGKMHTIVAWRR